MRSEGRPVGAGVGSQGTDRPEGRDDKTRLQGIPTVVAAVLGRGWHVLPVYSIVNGWCGCRQADCTAPGKHPRTQHGFKDASADASVVREWATRWPGCNWAVRTGAPHGPTVIDLDPRHGGYESFDRFEVEERGESLPETLRANTGGGGAHLYFAPSAVQRQNGWRDGVDVSGVGGYVLLPGSRHLSGATYEWDNWDRWARTPLPAMPEDVLRLLGSRRGRPSGSGGAGGSSGLAGTAYLREHGLRAGQRDDGFQALAWREVRLQYPDRAGVERVFREVWQRSDQPSRDHYPLARALEKVERAWAAIGPDVERTTAWARGLEERR